MGDTGMPGVPEIPVECRNPVEQIPAEGESVLAELVPVLPACGEIQCILVGMAVLESRFQPLRVCPVNLHLLTPGWQAQILCINLAREFDFRYAA